MNQSNEIDLMQLRREYAQASLSEADVATDPLQQFDVWLKQAMQSGLLEPYAMTLATASAQGQPSARIVLLRQYDTRGYCFFTNYNSNKGQVLAQNSRAALLFYWDVLERQVRIEGEVERVTPEESDAYYQQRPLGNRLSAWASPQSAVIPGREALLALEQQTRQQWGERPACPPHWGGYRLKPQLYEFWQGRPSRLHDRIRYVVTPNQWRIERLAP